MGIDVVISYDLISPGSKAAEVLTANDAC